MVKTNWQDPGSSEIRSTQISGLQEAVGKIEQSIGIQTATETDIPLSEVFISVDDRFRIYQAPTGKRNWLISPAPVIKQNGVVISPDFEIDYGGGAIIFSTPILETDVVTADATYTINESSFNDNVRAIKSPIGFPNRADSTFSFDKTTRTFTIEPTGTSYEVFCVDKKFVKTEPESVIIPNTTGLYYIYFNKDTGALTASTTFPGLDNMVYISYVYWNAAQANPSLQFAPGDERHGTVMDKATHHRLHAVDWTQWVSGLQLYGHALDDTSNNDAVKVSINNGFVADEDLQHYITHSSTPDAFFEQKLQGFAMLPVLYKDGADGNWKQDVATEYPFKNFGSGRIAYNQFYEGSWKQTQLGSGQFVAYYIVFAADIEQPIKVIQGQRSDNSLSAAQANNDDRNIQWGNSPFQEFKVLYRLIFETNGTFTNDRKACLRDVLDLRAARRSPGGGGIVPSAHSNLTGLDYESSGHIGFAKESEVQEVIDVISNGATQSPTLSWGMNHIQIPEVPVSPVIEFEGFDYVNLLGKDGNCEDVSRWIWNSSSVSLDTTNKVFGNNSFKITMGSAELATVYKSKSTLAIDASKYYLFSCYLKNGNASNDLRLLADGLNKISVLITDTTKFSRVCIKLSPSEMALVTAFHLYVRGTANSGQYGYFDGAMLNEISSSDYALSESDLLAKYPYVDSYACLTNPYFENRRYNLVRNGNCEEGVGHWSALGTPSALAVSNGKFVFTAGQWNGYRQLIKVKPNTDYYIKANVYGTGGEVIVTDITNTIGFSLWSHAFNTGTYSEVMVHMRNTLNENNTITVDSIMLVEGTEPPEEYKSCDLQRFVVEGQFAQGDKVRVENKKVSGLLNWKHRALYGKDFDWTLTQDAAGSKEIQITNFYSGFVYGSNGFTHVKYDGKILTWGNAINPDNSSITSGHLYLGVTDTDSGWTESAHPNNDEIKAFMNGWKTILLRGGRYVLWKNIIDNSLPPIVKYTTVTANSSGTTITVSDASIFKIGDSIGVTATFTSAVYYAIITNISGNVLTIDTSYAVSTGYYVIKCDNGTTDLALLTWCKNNIAPGYEGYKLHYKLANPEPITDVNVHVEGEIWDLGKGDNYVMVDSGIVLGEVATPYVDSSFAYFNVLSTGHVLKHPNEVIYRVYKNDILLDITPGDITGAFGKQRFSIPIANYDTNAAYTVDYQILKTLHAQTFGSLSLSYPQSIISTLEGHSKALEQKQSKDSALDSLIDLSVYEELTIGSGTASLFTTWSHSNGFIYVETVIPFKAKKKAVPTLTISKIEIATGNGSSSFSAITNSFIIYSYVDKDKAIIRARSADATIISNIKSYGAVIAGNVIADCRGRI